MKNKTEGHCPVSLEDWLKACDQAGVPAVPAERLTQIRLEDLMQWDVPGEHQTRLKQNAIQIIKGLKARHMVRYDCCAPSVVKDLLSRGKPDFDPAMTSLNLDDPRLWETANQYPRPLLPVWQRPWIRARMEAGYPVEYRVFVDEGKIRGISNYYPQRELQERHAELQQVRDLAQMLVDSVKPPFQWHRSPELLWIKRDEYDQRGPHFTADFIITHEGHALFLEGGPPHCLGAHHCCFQPGAIHGVALKNRNRA